MATFTKLNGFVEHLAEGVHNLGSGQLAVALSNTAPGSEATPPTGATTDCVLANVTQVYYAECTFAQNVYEDIDFFNTVVLGVNLASAILLLIGFAFEFKRERFALSLCIAIVIRRRLGNKRDVALALCVAVYYGCQFGLAVCFDMPEHVAVTLCLALYECDGVFD